MANTEDLTADTHLVWMVFQTLPAVRFPDVGVRAVAVDAEDLVVVLRLAALQRDLRLLQLRPQRTHVRVAILKSRLLDR